VTQLITQNADFVSQLLNLLFVSGLGMIRLANLGEKIRTTTAEVVMMKAPILGFFAVFRVLQANRIGTNLVKAVKVELADKAKRVLEDFEK
jgi:hypothetical protein